MPDIVGLFDLVLRPESPLAMSEMKNYTETLPDNLLEYEGPVKHANKNFLGVLLFHTEQKQKALDCFRDVLEEDAENINALLNCCYVYKRLGLRQDAKLNEYETRLNEILDDANIRKPLITARHWAELGVAMSFDFTFYHGKIFSQERFEKAIAYFEKALKTPAVFAAEERYQWLFFGARAYHRVYDRFLRRSTTELLTDCNELLTTWATRCVEWASTTLQNSESALFKSLALELLGTLFMKVQPVAKAGQLKRVITKCSLQRDAANPGLCFQRARHLCPDDAKLVCRHARFCMQHSFQRYTKAIALLDQSIEMDSSQRNWFAFSSRALALKRLYQQRNTRRERSTTAPVGEDLLQLAKTDLERLLGRSSYTDRLGLAEVCHLLGLHTSSKDILEEALSHFCEALDNLENRHYALFHIKRGNCLKDYGEIRGAIESYKTAMECESGEQVQGRYHKPSFDPVMKLMLEHHSQEGRPDKVTSELAFWFDYGFKKYPETAIRSTVDFCCREFTRGMFLVCMKLSLVHNYGAVNHTLPILVSNLETIVRRGRKENWPRIHEAEEHLMTARQTLEALYEARRSRRHPSEVPREVTSKPDAALQHTTGHELGLNPICENIKQPRNRKNKMSDFCVLYSDKEREWVCYSMVPKLETLYRFKGFIQDRDVPYGREKTDEIGQAIENSICTIAVLTPDFLEDGLLHKMLLGSLEEEDHDIIFFQYSECKVPKRVTKLSSCPVIIFPDWHSLITKLENLTS